MKKTVKLIAALCLMAALVLSLAACGDKDPVGTWECTNIKDLLKASVSEEELALVEGLLGNISITMTFNKDKTCTFKMSFMGQNQESSGTWVAGDKSVDVTVEGDTQPFLWDGNKLTLTGDIGLGLGDTKLIFEKK